MSSAICFNLDQSKILLSVNGFRSTYLHKYFFLIFRKASFLVVFNAKSASCSFKIRQSHRHNIPVVGPKYVDQCLTRKRLLDVSTFKLIDENNNERFTRGKIVGK